MNLTGDYIFNIKNYYIKNIDDYYVVLFKDTHKYIVLVKEKLEWLNALINKKSIGEVFLNYDLKNKNKEYLDFLSDVYWAQNKGKKKKPSDEFAIKYDMTFKCNTNCAHCFLPSFPNMNELSIEEWKFISDKILNSLDYKPALAISGGEALLFNDKVKQLIDYVRPRVDDITLLTNGFIFSNWIDNNDKENIDFYVKNIDYFQISLDGFDEVTFDSIRGKGNFRKVVNTIKYLNNIGKPLCLHTTISKNNMNAIEENFVDFVTKYNLYKNNINHFSFSVVRALGNGKTMEEKGETCSTLEYELFLSRLQKRINEVYPQKFPDNDDIISSTICSAGTQLTVSPNGMCYLCGLVSDDPLCNILVDDIEEIKAKLSKLHKDLDQKYIEECNDCELKGFCFGRCRVNNKMETGSYTKVKCNDDVKEEFYRSIIRENTLGLPY